MARIAIPPVTPGMPSDLLASARTSARPRRSSPRPTPMSMRRAPRSSPASTLTGEGGYQSPALQTLFRPESAFFNRGGRADPADLRRRASARPARSAQGPAGRTAADLSQGGHQRLCRCRPSAHRGAADGQAGAAAARGGQQHAARLRDRRDAAAGGHHRPGHRAEHPDRRCSRPRTCWPRRGWPGCRRWSALFQALGGGWQKPPKDELAAHAAKPLTRP